MALPRSNTPAAQVLTEVRYGEKTKAEKGSLRGKARMRMEIVEAMRGLHKVAAVSEAEVMKTTLHMLGKDALPK